MTVWQRIAAALTLSLALAAPALASDSFILTAPESEVPGIAARNGLVVMDRVKAKKIDTLEGVTFTGMSKQIQKGMITTSSCPFVAIRRRNPDGKVT